MKYSPKELEETADASRGKATWKTWLQGLTSIVIFSVIAYISLGLIADFAATRIPDSLEAKLFQSANIGRVFELERPEEGKLGKAFTRAETIFNKLIAAEDLRDIPYHIGLVEFEGPNAVAIPGGFVGVTGPLLRQVDDEIALAFVLAHELGHHQHRHTLKNAGRGLIYALALVGVGMADDSDLVGLAVGAAMRAHSRAHELEADRFGLLLVHKAYGHTEGAEKFFELIQREHESPTQSWSYMLETHPLTADRIEALEKLRSELPGA